MIWTDISLSFCWQDDSPHGLRSEACPDPQSLFECLFKNRRAQDLPSNPGAPHSIHEPSTNFIVAPGDSIAIREEMGGVRLGCHDQLVVAPL